MDYYWIWMAIGFGLIFFEILTPGFYFLWIGLSAVVVGAFTFFFPEVGFIVTGFAFAILSVVFCYLGKMSLYKKIKSSAPSTLNRRGEQYLGTTVLVVEKIVAGSGKVKVGDSIWPVKSNSDKDEGEFVKIVGVDGIYFMVE